MGRRAKSKQEDPPTLDEFRGEKPVKSDKISRRAKKRAHKSQSDSRNASKKKGAAGNDEDEDEDDELDSAKADLFDSDEEPNSARPMFSDDEGDEEQLDDLNQLTASGMLKSSDEEEDDDAEGDEFSEEEMDSFDEAAMSSEDEDGEDAGSDSQEEIDEFDEEFSGDEDGEGELEDVETAEIATPDLRVRIMETIKILDDVAGLGRGKPRSFYTQRLLGDIVQYYGYSEYMAEKYFQLFSPAEAIEFFEANEVPRPVVIRTNTLKTTRRDLAQALTDRGVNLQPLGNWSKVGLQVFDSQVPVGATPEYLAGHYILQAASSFLPVMALNPQPGERVLDMAAAPGGKTTYLSALMKDTGIVMANDTNKARAKSLIANIHRLGCTNTIVCHYDAREFPKVIGGFDKVLLDAPCSGTGVVSKDQQVKTSRTEKDFLQLPHLQKQLLLAAIDSVDHTKPDAAIVYSTCSVMPEENEAVVDYALKKRPNVELVDTGLPIGRPGFTSYRGKVWNQKVSLTRRYYPHTYNVDGFYVAKFRKTGPSPSPGAAAEEKVEEKLAEPFADFESRDDEEFISKSLKRSQKRRGVPPAKRTK